MGTLVMTKNYEGDRFQLHYAQSTPFNPPLEWCGAHSARARAGLRGSPVGPKVVKRFFFKVVPRPFGVLKQLV